MTKGYRGDGGYSGTAIDAQYQRQKATEVFGPFGTGWGVKDSEYQIIDFPTTREQLCLYTAKFWYYVPGEKSAISCFDISASIKVQKVSKRGQSGEYVSTDPEFAKKVATNALTKGLSALGFNADIFLGKFEDNNYVQEAEALTQAELDLAPIDETQLASLIKMIPQLGDSESKTHKMFCNRFEIEDIASLPKYKFSSALILCRQKRKEAGQ